MKTNIIDAPPAPAMWPARFASKNFARRAAIASWLVLLTAGLRAESSGTVVGPVQPNANPPADATTEVKVSTDPDEGAWRYASRLTTLLTYDDNIFIRPTNARDDWSLRIAPSVAMGIGNFRSEFAPYAPIPHFLARTGEEDLPRKNFAYASYTPDVILFATHHEENAVNHDVRLAGRRERELLSVQGQFHFQRISDTDIDVGRRIRQTYYTAEGGAAYALTGKMTGRLGLHGDHSEYAGGFSSTGAQVTGFVDYQLAPKTEVGLGAAGGYLFVAHGGDQTYAQPLFQLRYQPREKLSFTGEAGEEFRHFDSDVKRRTQFVFAVSGDYAAADGTNFTFASRRETRSSAQYSGENIVATTYQGGVRQRFWRRNYLALSGGFVRNDYENNQTISAISRRDNYYFGRVSSSRDLTEHGTVELSYEHRTNDSSAANFGFDENLVLFSASFLF